MIHLPDIAAPEPVASAAEALHTAEARLTDARHERLSREAALKEAAALDRQALADRLINDPDARPSHEARHRAEAELAEAVEIEQACAANFEAATERAARAALEHVSEWAEAIETARAKSDREFNRAVTKLTESEQRRATLRGVAAWLERFESGGERWLRGGASNTIKPARAAMPIPGELDIRDPRNANAKLPVALVLELLTAYSSMTSVAGEREAAERRAEGERQAEERRERIRELRAGEIQLH